MTSEIELIVELHELGCVQFGRFTMASGLRSPVYIDLRRIMAKPSLLKGVAQIYADISQTLTFDHLAAVPYAALTIGTAVSLATNHPLIYPRKETKAYGSGRTVEGIFSPGDKALIIEDLVTRGGSALKAIEALEAVDLVVSDVVVLIDREQGGPKLLAEKGYQLHSAFQLSEIIGILYREDRISKTELTTVQHYLATGQMDEVD